MNVLHNINNTNSKNLKAKNDFIKKQESEIIKKSLIKGYMKLLSQ